MKICKQCKQTETASEQNEYCEDCFAYNFFDEDDEQGFECCSDCDNPDACEDFGCAINQGILLNP